MLKKEIAVRLMKHLVDHNYHGYSQKSRWGDGEGTCNIEITGKVYELEQGDRDCSSAIISAYEAAGISCGGATYTGNMRSNMVATGNFRWHPMRDGYVAKAGDVYLNEGNHTAMCLSEVPDLLMEFSISETGGIDGEEGDQTGWESHTCAYYNYPWDGILECINTENASIDSCYWIKDNVGWWYRYADGSYPKNCWLKLDSWYYFNEHGYAIHDQWVYYKNKWYYLKSDCRMATGWAKVNGYWYYLDNTGAMLTGWQKINGYWYYLRPAKDGEKPEGSAVTGWLFVDDYWYYLLPKKDGSKPECSAAVGWYKVDNEWYDFNESNNCQPVCSMMLNHWTTYKGKKYYLKDDGKMAHGETIQIGGIDYTFNDGGSLK